MLVTLVIIGRTLETCQRLKDTTNTKKVGNVTSSLLPYRPI
jgi:hypothetical protein